MDDLNCPHCLGHVPAGDFCGLCGRPLLSASRVEEEPADVVQEGAAAPAPTSDSEPLPVAGPQSRSSQRLLLVACAVTVGGGLYLVAGTGESHTVTGALSLSDMGSASRVGAPCSASLGYHDVAAGAQVVVADESGSTVATDVLGPGTWDGIACVFPFRVEDVPKAAFYRVQVGSERRGELQYSYADMADTNWSVHLTLGEG